MEIGESVIFPKPRDSQETDLYSLLQRFANDVCKILNRGIIFEDNIDCVLVTLTSSATPDVENTVAHTLGKVPKGYLVYGQDKAGSLYKGTTTWTNSNIYLKSNVASVTFNIIIF